MDGTHKYSRVFAVPGYGKGLVFVLFFCDDGAVLSLVVFKITADNALDVVTHRSPICFGKVFDFCIHDFVKPQPGHCLFRRHNQHPSL